MEGKSGHQNQHSLHLYLTEIIGFCQLKSEGFVEVSGDISTRFIQKFVGGRLLGGVFLLIQT